MPVNFAVETNPQSRNDSRSSEICPSELAREPSDDHGSKRGQFGELAVEQRACRDSPSMRSTAYFISLGSARSEEETDEEVKHVDEVEGFDGGANCKICACGKRA